MCEGFWFAKHPAHGVIVIVHLGTNFVQGCSEIAGQELVFIPFICHLGRDVCKDGKAEIN